jgi:nucleoside-diphosphate-sugar epimerase
MAVARHKHQRPLYGARLLVADRSNPDVVEALLAAGPAIWIDTAVNDYADATALFEGARRVAATGAALPRFVIMSSIGEFGPALTGSGTITADSQTSADDDHSAGKLRAFEFLRNAADFMSITWAILPQMWGPNDHSGDGPQGRTTRIIRAVASSRPVYFRGTCDNLIPDGYVDTIAQALVFLAEAGPVAGIKRILVAGPSSLTPRDFVQEAAQALSVTPEIIVLPPDQIDAAVGGCYAPVFPEYDLKMNVSELYESGFMPSADWRNGVRNTAHHFERPGIPF